jgi:hypothetical protein
MLRLHHGGLAIAREHQVDAAVHRHVAADLPDPVPMPSEDLSDDLLELLPAERGTANADGKRLAEWSLCATRVPPGERHERRDLRSRSCRSSGVSYSDTLGLLSALMNLPIFPIPSPALFASVRSASPGA